tara:strand:+ start:386 stop:778 length:393 start_codon:yes stop_codon:yes gene_type:complete
MKNNDKTEMWTMTGTEARAYVQGLKNNPMKYGTVTINMYLACRHVEKTEDNGKYEEDTYGSSEWEMNTSSIELRWKDFLAVCKEADSFSAIKQERFKEVGDDTTSAELGTGISISARTNEYFRYTTVWVS